LIGNDRGDTSHYGFPVRVTERKRAEEQIRKQAELLDQAQDAILVRDLNHNRDP